MKVIDEAGNILARSLWKQLHLHPEYFSLNRLLIQNIPHGCTMVINKAMRDMAVPVPEEALLHDHWIALLASVSGKWDYFNEATVLLRNHDSNVTRKKTSVTQKVARFSGNAISKDQYEYFMEIRVAQAEALQRRRTDHLTSGQSEILRDFLKLKNTSGWKRKKILLKHKFYRTTFWHTLKMLLRA